MKRTLLFTTGVSLLFWSVAGRAEAGGAVGLELVADGLTAPNLVTHAADGSGRLFILDQAGQIRIVDAGGSLLAAPFLDLSSKLVGLGAFGPGSFDERGLLGLAFHPDFLNNDKFYVYYSAPRVVDTSVNFDTDAPANTDPFTVSGIAFAGGIAGTQFSPPLYSSGTRSFEVASGATATITFAQPVARVRFFFVHRATATAGSVRAFDADNNLLLGPISSNAATIFGDPANFVTLQEGFPVTGIKRLDLEAGTGLAGQQVLFVDDLQVFDYNHTSRVSEFTVSAGDPNVADASSERVVLEIGEPEFNHNAGSLAFGPDDGFLYISAGDGGNGSDLGLGHNPAIGNGQDLGTLLGKILRIDVDGGMPFAIPLDNPFVNEPGARGEIWAFGLRNPFRFSFDSGGTHDLFCGDAGQDLFEEASIVTAGANMGWPIKEGLHCFDQANPSAPPAGCPGVGPGGRLLVDPILEYPHFDDLANPVGQVIIGGNVYRGGEFPGLVGTYVFGDFSLPPFGGPADGSIFLARQVAPGTWQRSQPFISTGTNGRLMRFVMGFGQDESGEVYVCTNEVGTPFGTSGAVFRLVPADGDMDRDGDVDLNDFSTFANCFALTSPTANCAADRLARSDMNGDGTVDLNDFATFALNFSGSS
jgi:glucose/arabinose dehydrogenase